jgi:ribosomal protein S18 acetylase RimI-like enzyme
VWWTLTESNVADIICLHAKDDVEGFARRNPFLHLYTIGDLDDFFWPYTTWYALRDGGQIHQLVLLYTGQPLPVILALAEPPAAAMCELLRGLLPRLPRRFYAHLTEHLAPVFAGDYRIQPHGAFRKMGLIKPACVDRLVGAETVGLSDTDLAEVQALYDAAYPGNWFMPRMLQTGFYFGIRRGAALVSVAGVHVVSQRYKVATLGNIATRPEVRGKGLATAATSRLCQELLRAGINHVGLNVKADNRAAIACYEKIGFEWIADYGEYSFELK